MVDLLQIIQNIVDAISPASGGGLTGLMFILAWVIGVTLVIIGIRQAATRGENGRQAGSWSQPMWTVIIGVCFVALPGLSDTLAQTFFAQDTPDPSSIFSYAPATVGMMEAGSPARNMIVGIVTIIRFLGFIAIMRGLLLLRETANGGGQRTHFGAGITFVCSGAFAINFPLFMAVMESLFV